MPPKTPTAEKPATQKDEALIFLWTCMKNAGEIKIDYKAVAEALNLTTGAASKRFSRLKQRMDAETGAATGATAGEEGGQPAVTTPSKGTKRAAATGDGEVEGESPSKKTKAKPAGQKGKGKKGVAVDGTGAGTAANGTEAEMGKVKVKEEVGGDSSSEWDAN